MALLNPQRIEDVKLTQRHLELIAYELRRWWFIQYSELTVTEYATWWADELKYHNRNFKRELFIKAVTTGEL